MPAVRTTIVGGRPPGSGVPVGSIPRGVEILIQKAAVDPDFKAVLLAKRSAAAAEVELTLSPAEAAILDAVPADQLEAIIAGTKVPEKTRRVLLGTVTVAALGALGAAVLLPSLGSRPDRFDSLGMRPEDDREPEPAPRPEASPQQAVPPAAESKNPSTRPSTTAPSRGIRPDRPAGSR
jgi:hypothetical protein